MSQPTPSGPPATTDETADVIVVGAGPGGSATAAYLAAHGVEVMRLATKYGLPRKTLMKFLLKVMANLGETKGGRVDDRLISALAKMAPAA